jgi:mediator of RNA polymerase II transcription subunit 6
MAEASSAEENKKHVCFIDEAYICTFGLSPENILDYFALSLFYDHTSNNQAIRTQGAPMTELLKMTGVEYVSEPTKMEPALFVIKKQNRISPSSAEVLEMYYVLQGVIYQSPSILDCLSTRIAKSTLYLDRATTAMMAIQRFDANKGSHLAFTNASNGNDTNITEPIKVETISRLMPSFAPTIENIKLYCTKKTKL